MIRRLITVTTALAAVILATATAAQAATFNVTSQSDAVDANIGNGVCGITLSGGPCTLRAAIQEANFTAAADTITVPAGTYTLDHTGSGEDAAATGDLDITNPVTISGAGAASTTVNGFGASGDRVFQLIGSSATLSGMTITNGNPGGASGGGIENSGTLTLDGVTVSSNTTSSDGGGIDNTNVLTISNSTITGNHATSGGSGGGINNGKRATLTNVTVSSNTAGGGGGGIETSGQSPDGLFATDVTVSGNSGGSGSTGGGIDNSANASLTRVDVTGNSVTGSGSGGGVWNSALSPDQFVWTDGSVSHNTTGGGGFAQGAGISNTGNSAALTRVSVTSNTSAGTIWGGGIGNSGTVSLTDVGISGNSGGDSTLGAGLYASGETHLTRVDVSGNTGGASTQGGGIYNSALIFAGAGGLTGDSVTVSGNTVGSGSSQGAGVYWSGEGTLTNTTVSGNSGGTGTQGAGVWWSGDGAITNATIAANTGPGGGLWVDGTATVLNTIVASNNGANCAGGGTITSGGHNLAGDGSCPFGAGGDLNGIDPALGPVTSNGGTVQTRALLPTSPAIDAGSDSGCPSLDARGVTRPQLAHCDIGAYEYSPPVASLTPPPCSPSGVIDASVAGAQGGASPTAIFTSLDGGPVQRTPVTDGAAQISVPEGLHTVEYWGESTGGDVELVHHSTFVLVDATAPTVSITSDQGTSTYLVGQVATVTIHAADGGSGLATDPSAAGRPLDTSAPGTPSLTATAVDRCGNAATASFTAHVLAGLPRPVAGRTLNVSRVSGVVSIKQPGSPNFVPLTTPSQIRNGSIIDARKGRVRITIDDGLGHLDTADFYEGIFKFLQPAVAKGKLAFANLYLFAGRFKGCPKAPAHPRIASAAKKGHRSVRHLWGSGGGAFRTVGRFSAATVRGTTWLTADRCDGTLTRVTAGKVGVRDFVKKKTIVVKKGKSYFAAPK